MLYNAERSFEISGCILKEIHTECPLSHWEVVPGASCSHCLGSFPSEIALTDLAMEPVSWEQEHRWNEADGGSVDYIF